MEYYKDIHKFVSDEDGNDRIKSLNDSLNIPFSPDSITQTYVKLQHHDIDLYPYCDADDLTKQNIRYLGAVTENVSFPIPDYLTNP